jgi:hypothetical protein
MNRVLLLALPVAKIVAACERNKVGISAVEALASGGCRLVCLSQEGAEAMRRTLGQHLIKGSVVRTSLRVPGRPRR